MWLAWPWMIAATNDLYESIWYWNSFNGITQLFIVWNSSFLLFYMFFVSVFFSSEWIASLCVLMLWLNAYKSLNESCKTNASILYRIVYCNYKTISIVIIQKDTIVTMNFSYYWKSQEKWTHIQDTMNITSKCLFKWQFVTYYTIYMLYIYVFILFHFSLLSIVVTFTYIINRNLCSTAPN